MLLLSDGLMLSISCQLMSSSSRDSAAGSRAHRGLLWQSSWGPTVHGAASVLIAHRA